MKTLANRTGAVLALSWLALALGAWGVGAATAPAGHGALRKLLRLPLLRAEFGLQLSVEEGFILSGSRRDWSAQLQELKESNQGNAFDANRQFRLFELYRASGETVQASNALAQATESYRRLAQAQSENAEVLARFGRALDLIGRDAEAEAVLRRAVKTGPTEWRAWSALGLFLMGRGWSALTSDRRLLTRSPEQLLLLAAKKQISQTQLEQAEENLREGLACLDRAVSSAPKEPQAHADRALGLALSAMLNAVRDVLRGGEMDTLRFYQAMFTTNAQPDLEQMAALAPEDPALLAKSVLFQLIAAATRAGKTGMEGFANGELWRSLGESQQQSLRRSLTTLENLGQNGNSSIAAGALEFLGGFQWMAMRDRPGAEKNLRHALALDPKREAAWDFLMALLVDSDRNQEALVAAETRLRAKDSPRNRVAAAKICDRLGRLDKAQAHLDAALKLVPGDYLANLSAAIIALKQSDHENNLKHAEACLQRAGRAEGRPASKSEWIEWTLTTGIFWGLSGDVPAARKHFRQVLETDPENAIAKAALSIVGN